MGYCKNVYKYNSYLKNEAQSQIDINYRLISNLQNLLYVGTMSASDMMMVMAGGSEQQVVAEGLITEDSHPQFTEWQNGREPVAVPLEHSLLGLLAQLKVEQPEPLGVSESSNLLDHDEELGGDPLDEESSVSPSNAGTGDHFKCVAESELPAEWEVGRSDLREKCKSVLESELAKKSGVAVDAKKGLRKFSGQPHMVDGR